MDDAVCELQKDVSQVVWSVGDLTQKLRGILEENFFDVCVTGEVSNFKLHSSGHAYFSLKDNVASIQVAMFGFRSKFKMPLENGEQIKIFGKISVFLKRGNYQILARSFEQEGKGPLQIAFEKLYKKLDAEGLFASKRKRLLAKMPMAIGVVTSSTGAALKDILNVLGRRWPLASVFIYPCTVQGLGAGKEIAEAIEESNRSLFLDTLIVSRGGGTMEDLWAFNEEVVARAVFEARIPVISGVGHQVDFTICDYVADYRAPTPSAAAEASVPERSELLSSLLTRQAQLCKTMRYVIQNSKNFIKMFSEEVWRKMLERNIVNKRLVLKYCMEGLENRGMTLLKEQRFYLSKIISKMETWSPERVLRRGYAMLQDEQGASISSLDAVLIGQVVRAVMKGGTLRLRVEGIEIMG